MDEYKQKEHIILNELSDKDIDKLYLKIMTENTYGGYILAIVYPNKSMESLNIIKNFNIKFPSNYIWKSLQIDHNEYNFINILKKDYYRVGKLNVILRELTIYNTYYYLDLYYLKHMVEKSKLKDIQNKEIKTKLKEHKEIIIQNYIDINDDIIKMELNIKSIETKLINIEKDKYIQMLEIKINHNENELSKITKDLENIVTENDLQTNHLYIKLANLENINKMIDLYYICVLIIIIIIIIKIY